MSTLELRRHVSAPPERVFSAFTDPEQLAEWWGPEGFRVPHATFEARPGAPYRIEMQPPDGDAFALTGEVREAEAPSRLVYTFVWEPPDPEDVETVVALTFRAADGGTDIELRQGEFRTDARYELHRVGWTETFDRLQRRMSAT